MLITIVNVEFNSHDQKGLNWVNKFESFFGGAINSVLSLIIPPLSTDLIHCRFYHHLSVTKFIVFLVVFLDDTQGFLSVSISFSPILNMSSFLNIVNNGSNSTMSSL
jgi:hypothetical protein